MDDLLYLIWLYCRRGVGTVAILSLLRRYESAKAVWEIRDLDALAGMPNISKLAMQSIVHEKSLDEAYRVLEIMERQQIGLITYFDPSYPPLLRRIDNAPILLFYKGENIFEKYDPAIAIVGSRKATTYGLNEAYKLAKDLALSGLTIVSGLATGIDRASHIGAIDAKGLTIAVLGNGVDVIYPRGSREAYNAMLRGGHMIISEFLPGQAPVASNFPRRNRIISGLCLGTVIVEAAKKSGSLITANYALSQGREVFAFPGNITSHVSEGTNRLIMDGAHFITKADDILRVFYDELKGKICYKQTDDSVRNTATAYGLSAEGSAVYERIRDGVCTKDELVRALGYSISQVNTLITLLEINGLVMSENGKLYII